MTALVPVDPDDIDALVAARATLVVCRDFAHACVIDELIEKARAARQDEITDLVVAELSERRGRLKVVET